MKMRVVDVYPYRLSDDGSAAFLVLRRAPGTVYAGAWRMVGGKIEPTETAPQAARRELREETGRDARLLWTLPSVNVFYEWREDCINLVPAFAAEIDRDPLLDAEHDAWAWLPAPEAAERLAWTEQRRLLLLAHDILGRGIVPELIVDR